MDGWFVAGEPFFFRFLFSLLFKKLLISLFCVLVLVIWSFFFWFFIFVHWLLHKIFVSFHSSLSIPVCNILCFSIWSLFFWFLNFLVNPFIEVFFFNFSFQFHHSIQVYFVLLFSIWSSIFLGYFSLQFNPLNKNFVSSFLLISFFHHLLFCIDTISFLFNPSTSIFHIFLCLFCHFIKILLVFNFTF
jgi:hypothetical protein